MIEESKRVVWEHRKNGGRFMVVYDSDKIYEDNEYHILIAENVSPKDARVLCDQKQENTINSFLDDLPKELRGPKTDSFIANMIRNAE